MIERLLTRLLKLNLLIIDEHSRYHLRRVHIAFRERGYHREKGYNQHQSSNSISNTINLDQRKSHHANLASPFVYILQSSPSSSQTELARVFALWAERSLHIIFTAGLNSSLDSHNVLLKAFFFLSSLTNPFIPVVTFQIVVGIVFTVRTLQNTVKLHGNKSRFSQTDGESHFKARMADQSTPAHTK